MPTFHTRHSFPCPNRFSHYVFNASGMLELEREVEYKLSAANILNLHVTFAVAGENDSIKNMKKHK